MVGKRGWEGQASDGWGPLASPVYLFQWWINLRLSATAVIGDSTGSRSSQVAETTCSTQGSSVTRRHLNCSIPGWVEDGSVCTVIAPAGGVKEMSSILADQWHPREWAQMQREGRVARSQLMSTAVHRSPNELWRSNSIFDLWSASSSTIDILHKEKNGRMNSCILTKLYVFFPCSAAR